MNNFLNDSENRVLMEKIKGVPGTGFIGSLVNNWKKMKIRAQLRRLNLKKVAYTVSTVSFRGRRPRKLLVYIGLGMIVGLPLMGIAQSGPAIVNQKGEMQVIAARKLVIGCNKTCLLVFPEAIQSADRGAACVLAERVKGSENVLKVKAGSPGFMPSSLTVITTDGRVYPFSVSYTVEPPYLVLDFRTENAHENSAEGTFVPFGKSNTVHEHRGSGRKGDQCDQGDQKSDSDLTKSLKVLFKGVSLNSEEMKRMVQKVRADTVVRVRGVHTNQYGLDFRLEGIYYHKKVLFFRLRLQNSTGLPYQFSSLRFFIRDNKNARRTAAQDNELPALYKQSWGKPEELEGGVGQTIVLTLPRFTIADGKHLRMELLESEGDRALSLNLKERKFRKIIKL